MVVEVDNLGFVVAIAGAIFASAIVYILPSLLFMRYAGPRIKDGRADRRQRIEYSMNKVILCVGVLLAVLGAWVTFIKTFKPEILAPGDGS